MRPVNVFVHVLLPCSKDVVHHIRGRLVSIPVRVCCQCSSCDGRTRARTGTAATRHVPTQYHLLGKVRRILGVESLRHFAVQLRKQAAYGLQQLLLVGVVRMIVVVEHYGLVIDNAQVSLR